MDHTWSWSSLSLSCVTIWIWWVNVNPLSDLFVTAQTAMPEFKLVHLHHVKLIPISFYSLATIAGKFEYTYIIPNTAVFGPTNFIETTTTTTIASTRMRICGWKRKISKFRFLNLDLETNRFLNKSFFSKLERQKRLVDPPLKFFFLWRHRSQREAINPKSILLNI